MNTHVLGLVGEFTFNYAGEFFIETREGNFTWRSPDYESGDNSLRPFRGDYSDWLKLNGIPYGRSKGSHVIGHYCGLEVKIST